MEICTTLPIPVRPFAIMAAAVQQHLVCLIHIMFDQWSGYNTVGDPQSFSFRFLIAASAEAFADLSLLPDPGDLVYLSFNVAFPNTLSRSYLTQSLWPFVLTLSLNLSSGVTLRSRHYYLNSQPDLVLEDILIRHLPFRACLEHIFHITKRQIFTHPAFLRTK